MTQKEPGTFRKIMALLTPGERRRGALVLGMMLVLACLETAGVASVMPFLAVLGNPEMVETQPILAWMYEEGGFESVERFLFLLGLGAFGMVLFSACVRSLTTYAMYRWTEMRRYSIGTRLLRTYLGQPYEFFLDRNSADLSKSILSEVDDLVRQVFQPGLNMLAYSLVAIGLVGFLIFIDPVLALAIAAIVGGTYLLIYLAVRRTLSRIGKDRVVSNRERFTAASEALGGIKAVKVLGKESAFLARFRNPAQRFARHQTMNAVLSSVPKYVIEAVGVGGVILLTLVLLETRENLGSVLPLIGLYTFAGYRLLPAAQHIYAGCSRLRYGLPAVDALYEELAIGVQARCPQTEPSPFNVTSSKVVGLEFKRVSFRYPGSNDFTLTDVSFQIPAGTAVGIVGKTGAGKTTAVDLLLGLLYAKEGTIEINGVVLGPQNARAWQRRVGYVPQSIYLADASVAANIAFGVPEEEIDTQSVLEAAKIAGIHDFVKSQLAYGYRTIVGERGVRLSGGQRQRLGIARALYQDPDILVLDEATSSLDASTERGFIASLESLRGNKTIVAIAHRLSTVKDCDEIVVLEGGKIVGVGPYDTLRRSNQNFRQLAGVDREG